MMYDIKATAIKVQPAMARMIWTMSFSHWGCCQIEYIDDYMFPKFRMHIF